MRRLLLLLSLLPGLAGAEAMRLACSGWAPVYFENGEIDVSKNKNESYRVFDVDTEKQTIASDATLIGRYRIPMRQKDVYFLADGVLNEVRFGRRMEGLTIDINRAMGDANVIYNFEGGYKMLDFTGMCKKIPMKF